MQKTEPVCFGSCGRIRTCITVFVTQRFCQLSYTTINIVIYHLNDKYRSNIANILQKKITTTLNKIK